LTPLRRCFGERLAASIAPAVGIRDLRDMSTRVFFYGLYMDSELLQSMGFQPRSVGAAKLVDYSLDIGERATLFSDAGRVAYGYVLDLEDDEVSKLYSRPEVVDYRAESVEVLLLIDDSKHRALCYVLPESKLGGKTNRAYAEKLAALVRKMGLPTEYANEIARYESDA
jgi:hypothetical protein